MTEMSLRKKSPRTAKITRVTRNSSRASIKKEPPVKACRANVNRLNPKQVLPECTVNVVRVNINKNGKQTGTNDDKQIDNGKNQQPSKKVQKRIKWSEENNKRLRTSNEKSDVPVLNLRSRKPIKYVESSLEISDLEDQPNITKVPVYKQQAKDEKLTKRKADQYEFDSDSEKYKKQKKRKVENSSSEEYNRIVKKLVNGSEKTKKKNKKVIFSDKRKDIRKEKKTVTLDKRSNNNNNCLNRVTSQVGRNEKVTIEKNLEKSSLPDKKGNEKCVSKNQTQPKIAFNGNTIKSVDNLKSSILFKKDLSTMENQESPIDSSDDEYFGFATAEPIESPKIKILSDVQLTPRGEWNLSIASPRLFIDGKPDANSTMLNNVLTPWRFNQINVRRNPHFITLKKSALPCINQEMVLDHTIVDRLNESSKAENLPLKVNKTKVKKTTVQAKMDDYVDSRIERKENNESQLSLFDNDQFSPIKRRTKDSSRSNLVKRKILCEKNSDENECKDVSNQNSKESTPKSKIMKRSNQEDKYFGFDSLDDYSDKENSPIKEKHNRPFRLSVNINDKKYYPKKKLNVRKVESVAGSDEESDLSELSDTETENGEIKLFEDFNTTRELFEESRPLKKKKQKSKKRKDVRSKEEEEEAEKWATAFNSMCEEIEQFPLEIE